jgi:hypothetical protein
MRIERNRLYQVNVPAQLTRIWTGPLEPNQWPELINKNKMGSLRHTVNEYGISHEAVRRTLRHLLAVDTAGDSN